MIEASGQFPTEGKIEGRIENGELRIENKENSQLSTLNSQLNNNASNSQAATQLNVERLKLIDDVSRLLLELKNQFPELAQSLSKAREYISVNQENIPIKNLMNIFSEIQQNLEALENKPAPAQKLELIDTIKNLVNEAIKILQPNSEVPSENKLITALSRNDFASANTAIKNIVATPQLEQVQNSKIENFRVILNALQELKELGIPKELQKAPLKELEAIVLQRNGIEIPKEAVKNIPVTFGEKPVFATVSLKIDSANPAEPVRLQITPLPSPPPPSSPQPEGQPSPQVVRALHATPQQLPQQAQSPQQPQPTQPQQSPQRIAQTFEIVLPKDFPLQKILANIPLQQPQPSPQVRALPLEGQPRGVAPTPSPLSPPLSPPSPQSDGQPRGVAPTPSLPLSPPSPQSDGQPRGVAPTPSLPLSPPSPPPEGQPRGVAPTPSLPLSPPSPPPEGQPRGVAPTPSLPLSPPSPPPEGQPRGVAPTLPTLSQPQPPPPQKIELAFSLYQITPKTASDIPQQTKTQPQMQAQSQYILQPWAASVALPKEERNFWLKTELPLTPQILNIREAILASGKLPENPEIVRSFASNLHEMSLQTEHGTSVSKEQANLLWRVVQLNEQSPSPLPTTSTTHPVSFADTPLKAGTILNSPFSILNLSLLKYQPTGNYEGDLFKSLPEIVKRELAQELPPGKIWQPETLQKAVEKILEKYIEQPPANTANLNEHASKAHEEIRNSLQNLKEQIQWTRVDQDTRPQNDRENIFYFMHNGEMQKGRVKVRDERKGGSKKQQDSSISFTIKTKVKNLGEVHADLTLSKNTLNIRMQDEVGTASNAVKEERETLAKELSDIGITLGEILYGKTPKIQQLPVAKKEKSNRELDVMA